MCIQSYAAHVVYQLTGSGEKDGEREVKVSVFLSKFVQQIASSSFPNRFIMVWMRSIVSNHKQLAIRPRNNEKIEQMKWDPISE